MNQQPDKFFRDKLHNYESSPSPGAWKRISADTKHKPFLWLKVAAAIALLIVAGILIFGLESNQPPNVIAEKPIPDSSVTHRTDENREGNSEETIAEAHSEPAAAPTAATGKTKAPIINKKRNTPGDESKSADKGPIDPPQQLAPAIADTQKEAVPEIPDIPTLAPTPQSVAVLGTPRRKTVTIVFNAEEVNEKYLEKKTVAEATSDGKETSTLKKLLDKAYDLKHNQDPLGDLRQKKNEILALNFKSGKQRSKN